MAVITSGISLLKTYDVVVSLTGGGPAGSTKTLAYSILAVSFPQRDIGLAIGPGRAADTRGCGPVPSTVLFLRRRAEDDAESIG